MSKTFDIVQAMSGQKNVIVLPRPYLKFFSGDQQAHALSAVLSNLVFWSKHGDEDGWFYKSHEELGREAGELSEDQTERLVKKIISKYLPNVFETCSRKVNGTPIKHYRIDGEELIKAVFPEISETAKVRNRKRESTESKPRHRGMETATSRNLGNRESTESYLYTDCNTECNLQTITDGQLASPADTQQSRIDYQSTVDAYHEILPEMPKVLDLTSGRKDKLRTFWRKFDFTQERWMAYLRYIAKNCRWMCENRPDNASGRTWRKKNFDYLITERCYLAVKEERANDLPKTGAQRDITVIPSTDYAIPDGFRGA
ncbi:hypothetical protein [Pantoea ananatis]|uniref:hypothetical protein n=1 Tax=Pantoea ananas TaxID=553 RepID=UPI000A4E6D08|nr:hypothetical protein [Pantoea ananatis]